MVNPKMMFVYFSLIAFLLSLSNIVIQITVANKHEITTAKKHKGFSLNLIHRDSPNSPMYRPNHTKAELMNEYARSSKFRLKSLARLVSNDRNRVIRPSISRQDAGYLVKVGLGTYNGNPRYHTSYLDLDTASELSWTQCEGCVNCIRHVGPDFDSSRSHSYNPVPHSLCPRSASWQDDKCREVIKYDDNSHAILNLAYETFIFEFGNALVPLNGLSFGCGINMTGFEEDELPNNKLSGVLGMNYLGRSLVQQLQERNITRGKFSYCLQFINNQHPHTVPMILRFGDDIIQPRTTHSTPILPRQGFYYLDLRGLKVDNVDLRLRSGVFGLTGGGGGGFIIDSGTAGSYLTPEAFHALDYAMNTYIQRHNLNVQKYEDPDYELCYIHVQNHSTPMVLPSVTFTFVNNVEFKVQPKQIFVPSRTGNGHPSMCLFMFRSTEDTNYMSVLGSYQQVNHRIIYNTQNRMLQFEPADCNCHN